MNRETKRRRVLVEDFQYRLLAFNLLYFLATLLIFAAVLFVPLIIRLESSTLSVAEKQEVATQLLSLDARVWPPILVVFLLLAIHSVLISHRIAGPLSRFRRLFEAVADGDLSVRLIIRGNDYLAKEARLFNEMAASLGSRVQGIGELSAELRTLSAELTRAIESGSREAVRQSIERLAARAERLKASVDQFRIAAEGARAGDDSADEMVSASISGGSGGMARR